MQHNIFAQIYPIPLFYKRYHWLVDSQEAPAIYWAKLVTFLPLRVHLYIIQNGRP